MDAPVRLGALIAGKYRVDRVLGQGGMGVVVAAEHLMLKVPVAIKFLLADAGQNALARFEREARAAASIQSDAVAQRMHLQHGIVAIVRGLSLQGMEQRALCRASLDSELPKGGPHTA